MHFKDPRKIDWKFIFSLRANGFMIIGVLLAVVVLQGFLVPNHFLDGGVTGISILVKGYATTNISYFLILFNIPFLIMGYYKVSKTFAIQSLIAVVLLALGMNFISIPVLHKIKY